MLTNVFLLILKTLYFKVYMWVLWKVSEFNIKMAAVFNKNCGIYLRMHLKGTHQNFSHFGSWIVVWQSFEWIVLKVFMQMKKKKLSIKLSLNICVWNTVRLCKYNYEFMQKILLVWLKLLQQSLGNVCSCAILTQSEQRIAHADSSCISYSVGIWQSRSFDLPTASAIFLILIGRWSGTIWWTFSKLLVVAVFWLLVHHQLSWHNGVEIQLHKISPS